MLNDRVRETSTTTGTGSLTTLGAVTGFITFLSGFGTGKRCYYSIDNGTQWEIGIGTVTAGNLTRDTILENSSGGTSAINLSAGTKTIFCDCPAIVVATGLLLSKILASNPTEVFGGSGITIDSDNTIHNRQAVTVDTDGATITFDMLTSNEHQVTLAGNRTLALSNVSSGQKFVIKLIQDGTGSRTVTWFTTIRWPAATAPTLTTTAAKADWFGFILMPDGTYDGFILGQNL